MIATDVYLCTAAEPDTLRMEMAALCIKRWEMVDGINLYVITPEILNCSNRGFQRMRRIYADQNSESREYILTDDDALIPPCFDLNECLRVFRQSRFATLSLMPSNATINPWTPEDYIPEVTDEVMEHYAAGQVRFCLKGHLQEWPPMHKEAPGYDTIHGQAIRDAGGRCGYFRNHVALHLGEGYSSIWANLKVRQ